MNCSASCSVRRVCWWCAWFCKHVKFLCSLYTLTVNIFNCLVSDWWQIACDPAPFQGPCSEEHRWSGPAQRPVQWEPESWSCAHSALQCLWGRLWIAGLCLDLERLFAYYFYFMFINSYKYRFYMNINSHLSDINLCLVFIICLMFRSVENFSRFIFSGHIEYPIMSWQ